MGGVPRLSTVHGWVWVWILLHGEMDQPEVVQDLPFKWSQINCSFQTADCLLRGKECGKPTTTRHRVPWCLIVTHRNIFLLPKEAHPNIVPELRGLGGAHGRYTILGESHIEVPIPLHHAPCCQDGLGEEHSCTHLTAQLKHFIIHYNHTILYMC